MAVGTVAHHSPVMLTALLLFLSTGCEDALEEGGEGLVLKSDRNFDPPAEPPHKTFEEGYGHAKGHERPYLCRDDAGNQVTCPTDGVRPASQNLSCDAAGCHGIMEYDTGLAFEDRDLYGSDGPGCFSCHGREWSNTMTAGGD